MKFNKKKIKDLFGIETIDIKTRDKAGLLINNKVYVGISHNSTRRQYAEEMREQFHMGKDKYSAEG